MKNCEHELFCYEEECITDDEVKITMKCDLCNIKFKGVIKKQ
ncbi:MAG TPA: hypothetical protein VMZ91_16300 [Candidatus Paceibacterota bacterium]|nr:hypothetical protein [Candidatus Paceibacterota bacterium]